jgi:hypothetical protein
LFFAIVTTALAGYGGWPVGIFSFLQVPDFAEDPGSLGHRVRFVTIAMRDPLPRGAANCFPVRSNALQKQETSEQANRQTH